MDKKPFGPKLVEGMCFLILLPRKRIPCCRLPSTNPAVHGNRDAEVGSVEISMGGTPQREKRGVQSECLGIHGLQGWHSTQSFDINFRIRIQPGPGLRTDDLNLSPGEQLCALKSLVNHPKIVGFDLAFSRPYVSENRCSFEQGSSTH